MQVQVECTTETLNQCHCACLTCLSTEACLLDHPTRQATIDQSQHATHHRWPIRKQKSQRNREAQHPLTYRLIREYLIHQQSCTSAIRRAPQLGQNPLRLQLNASSCSRRQPSHLTRKKPCSGQPTFLPTDTAASLWKSEQHRAPPISQHARQIGDR